MVDFEVKLDLKKRMIDASTLIKYRLIRSDRSNLGGAVGESVNTICGGGGVTGMPFYSIPSILYIDIVYNPFYVRI